MLQPRDIQQHYGIPLLRPFRIVLCIALICIGTGLAQYSDDVYIVEPTPALRLNNQDLTTILLLNSNNNNNSNNRGVPTGRHINVKPTLGLLTSTARTFIQEGVTTEYATQVVGTTLDNGRVYAQLLKKSSRVLYDKDKPTTIAPTAKFPGAVQSLQTYSAKNPKMLLQSHNDIIGDKDWQLIDDHLLLVNKDSNGGKFGRIREQTVGENGRQSLLVYPVKSFNQDQESSNLNAFGNTSFTVSSSSSSSSSSASSPAGIGNNINAHKVLSAHNLPTFTIKNVFSPSGFSWDSPIDQGYLVDENLERISKVRVDQQQRTPKILQHDTPILSNEFRNMATVTYFGFADFTTVVGDTVIVFSPSTSAEMPSNGHITSIKGEATLNHIPQETAFVTHVPITVTQDLIEPTFTMQHVVGTVDPTEVIRPHLNHQESEAEADQSEISMPGTSEDYGSDDESASAEEYATTTEEESPLDTASRNEPQFELEPSSTMVEDTFTAVTQPTSEASTKVMLSRPSNEDISKIFASLASAEAAKKLAAQQTTQVPTTEKSIPVEPLTTTPPTTTSSESNEVDTTEQPSRESPIPVTDRPTENEVTTSDSKEESLSSTEPMPTVPEKPADEPESIPSLEIIAPETKVSGGVTTIFFEDDPFLGLEATTTQPLDMQTTALSSSTEAPISEITTTTESTEPENTTLEQQINEDTSESTSNSPVAAAAAAEKEELKHSNEECQDKTSEIIPTLVPKTLTYLTTFYISDAEETSTSIESNVVVTFDVSYSTKLFCEEIVSTPVVQEPVVSTSVTTVELAAAIDRPEIDEASLLSSVVEPLEDVPITTTPHMIITEKVHVTTEQTPATELNTVTEKAESDSESAAEEGDENLSEQSGEEIELIYKTLYTTYTYLTTFFQESTTSISSRKEIITNVITSTVTPGQLAGNMDADILASIVPTAVSDTAQPTSTVPAVEKGAVGESDLEKINGIIHEDEGLGDATDSMEGKVQADGVKTYYTTYTYFTTIFVDGETEIMSRTEIYTNYVTESADFQGVTARQEEPLEFTVSDDDNKVVNDISPTSTYAPSVQTNSVRLVEQALSESAERSKPNVDLLESSFASSSSTSSSSSESEIKMVTDVRSSSSDGDRHIIENINKHWNGLLEDQISSESNTDEILPSSTLLLQTSYTTFTYFTTMYIGNTASSILSRLETITNVVTETLQPTQMLKPEDSTLPITYFTTFTYWTTLYKDGEITTISREETVSNIVTPSAALEHIGEVQTMKPVLTVEASLGSIASTIEPTAAITTEPTIMATPVARESTTFYTTYTYFTTQYIGEETVVSSRFETVTNVVAPTAETVPATQSIADLQPSSTVETTSTQQVELAPTSPIPPPEENIIELNQGQIVDAEGVSTLIYLTKTVSTTINDQPTTTVVSSSSLHVDQVKKALLPTTESDTSSRTYKTGLVRLIDGTIIANATTTLYQSKVIGTIIEGRYAQIIESTSSFLIEKTLDPTTSQIEITPTSIQTLDSSIIPTAFTPISSANVVEGSINEGGEEKDHESGEGDDEEEDDEESGIDDNGRPKSRLTFQAKKKTFTPVIRPFASRNRPQFAPKRKNAAAGSATIITRSDFTPTITATPALKSDSSRGRFSSNRKGSSVIASSGSPSRKFSRPSGGSTRGVASSSAFPGGSRRGFASSRIQPTASASYFGGSSRRGGSSSQRGGSSSFGRASSIYAVDNSISTTPLSTVFETSVVRDSDHRVDNNEDIISLNSEDDLSESYGSGRFFNFQIFDGLQSSTPIAMADEARYNLATRIMSNGVEVIVAGDKTKIAGDRNNILRIVPSSLAKPMTLAPSTLKNQMILIAPNDSKENITIPINPNQFVTKTCLTTYTYRTTYLQDGTTTIESREKIISNIATEERNYLKISPTATSGFTLSRTPEFIIGVFHTTYTYLNTILDGELPLVLSSKHTVTNTITGPEDYISFLQPSEQATPVLETNTYYSRITMTKTLHDSNIGKIVSTSNIMRQVVITESLPSKSTSVMTSYIALDVTSEKSDAEDDLHIYATKTYLTTFTYFTTVLKSNSIQSSLATEVNSHIRVVENVITESIPNHLLEPDALDNFRNQLQLPSTRVITTLATLIGGQTLEVTAMRTPNLNQQSQLPLIGSGEVNEEHVTSAGFASLENEEEEDKDEEETLASDETKLEDDAENVVETIETASSDQNEQVYNALKRPSRNYTKIHDKNGLQVSNLIGSLNLNGLNALGPVINAMAGLINTNFGTPARRNYTNVKLSANEISSKNLLKNISSEHLSGNLNFDEFESDQKHLPIYIPVRSTHEVLNGNRLSSPSSLHIAPPKPVQPHQQKYLLQSDEKANRDSKLEITVGKPTHETPLLNGGIPISPGEVITANSDVIIGKPAGIRPRVPYQASQNSPILPPHRPNHLVSPKVIPLLQYKQHPSHLRVPPIHGTNPYPSTNPPPPPPHAQLTPPMHYSDHAHVRIPPPFLQSPHYPDHQKPLNNEILEIKKIPEVFSADLPVFEIKKIRGSEKNMLVNIQPSQVASVMIPHGNTSPVLIIESTSELHKNGQYFDEPAPYPNTILGSSSPGELAAAEPILKPHKPALVSSQITVGGVGESANAPVQVNLDSSVLSHNIDVHVPPLTFIKENEFPQSTAIRGQNAFNFQKHGQHNVNIPYYNRHVSVNIRPQHELADSPHFHRTQEYLVQGMEPPPKSLPPKKYNYFNQIPYNQHNLPQSYPPPPSSNQINVLHPYKGDKYHHQLNTLQQQQQHQLHQQQHHQLHLQQQQQLNHQQQQLHHHQQQQYNTQVVELPSYGSSHAPAFDNSPIDHSQAPSIVDGITDEHREDDYENEEGEVIQESNSLPVIPGQYIDYPTSTSQASFVNVSPFLNMPSASAINELPHMTMNNSDARISAQNSHPSPTNATLPSTGHPVLFREHFRNHTLFNKGGKQRTNSSSSAEVDIEHPQIGSLSIGSSSVHNEATDSHQTYVQAPRPIESYETNSSIPHSSSPQTERPFNGNTNNESLGNNSIISNDLDGESEEIFDFKESINPHNLEVINNLEEILPSERPTGARVTLPTTIQVSTSPNQVSIESMTEEVVGMSPPPLPNLRPGPIKRKPPRPLYSSPIRSPPSTFNYPTRNPLLSYTWSTLPPRSPLRPINESTTASTVNPPAAASDEQVPSSFVPPKKNYTTNYSSVTRTPPKYKQTSKLPPVLLQATTRKPNHYFSNRRPVASVNTTSVSVSTSISSSTSRSPVTQVRLPSLVLTAKINYTDDKSKNENIEKAEKKANEQNGRPDIKATPSNQYPQYIDITRTNTAVTPSASSSSSEERNDEDMLSEKQRVPDDILITGSEISVHTESHPATTSYLTHKETITVTQPVNVTTRTRLLSKIILPTKYITNTKTLTVTSTKTTVVKSQGIPSTQTLILTTTQTSTLIDTVTQTHTETLVKPTNVILDHATSTIATTFYTMPSPPPPHSPEKEPTPPDEVIADIGNDFFAKSTSEVPSPNTSPVPVIIRMGSMNRNPGLQNQSAQHDSIFVVMTDQKNIGLINLGSDRKPLSTQKNENIDHVNKALDASELPNRDEDTIHNESNHVLLGGVLIATPPKASNSQECRPDCKGSRNELCQNLDGHMRCVCRAGFARMFPDRPCKPTYTYKLSMPLQRIGKDLLVYDDSLSNKDSESYFNLASQTHEALDRMVMQSDFRDIYHGVHVTGLERAPSGKGLVGNFYLQLSDNSDEQRLVDVFRKYLRGTNYSVGGTELYSAQTSDADDLQASDFDECLDRQFHDCSENAHCFNLHGTYTCSCKEGFADFSENPVYPGRICSAEQIGCEKCHYHGSCFSRDLDSLENVVCECFPWYAGATCQLNLKILLIGLVAFGALLLILLFFCLLITCSKRRKNRSMQAIISGINILPPKGSRLMGSRGGDDKLMKLDKRAMIKDSSSEASHSLDTLPYVASKKSYRKDSLKKQSTSETSQRHSAVSPPVDLERHCNLFDQNDRSLTVMIPRAKYHPVLQLSGDGSGLQSSNLATAEAKLLSYWDASVSNTTMPTKKLSSANGKQHNAAHTTSTGALVSAGFEVSATVGQDISSTLDSKSHLMQKSGNKTQYSSRNSIPNSESQSQYGAYKKQPAVDSHIFVDPIDAWSGTLQHTELTASEVRSYDETTIQAQTKSFLSVYDKHSAHMNNDEEITMAERDIGSTFLLPHTHLYKPDRGSDDVSGFESF